MEEVALAELGQGGACPVDADEVTVVVFHGVELVELAAGSYQVAGEGDALAADLGDQSDLSLGVARRRHDFEVVGSPGKGLVVAQRLTHGKVLADTKEGRTVVGVVEDALLLPVVGGAGEELALVPGHGKLGPRLDQAVGTEALVAVVMGEQDPIDGGNADFGKMVEHVAGAAVYQ